MPNRIIPIAQASAEIEAITDKVLSAADAHRLRTFAASLPPIEKQVAPKAEKCDKIPLDEATRRQLVAVERQMYHLIGQIKAILKTD